MVENRNGNRGADNDLPLLKGLAIYRIRVQGRLDVKWTQRLGAMNITERLEADREVESILVERLDDQTALVGVLNSLNELHLPVLSTVCLERGCR